VRVPTNMPPAAVCIPFRCPRIRQALRRDAPERSRKGS
jgi:hypothetical protein